MDKRTLLTLVCNRLNKNKNFNISLKSIEVYKKNLWDDVLKIEFNYKNKVLPVYINESAFHDWQRVPWGGLTDFRPANWETWENDRKLILTMCWCIYKYCLEDDKGNTQYQKPPRED